MKHRQPIWKWLLLGVVALVLVAVAILPRLVGKASELRDRVTASLSEWAGGEVKLTGPLRVRYFPDVSINGSFELRKPSRLPHVESIAAPSVKISLDLPALFLGRIRIDTLRLTKPEIMLKPAGAPAVTSAETPEGLIANLLPGAPVSVIRISDGTIRVPLSSRVERIRKIYARLDAGARDGSVSGSGSFVFRREPVRFTIDRFRPRETASGPAVPISLSLRAKPITAELTGTAEFTDGLQLKGDMRVQAADLRRFLTWTGVAVPQGESLKALSATGPAQWSGPALSFDSGTFLLDGNRADGALAVTMGERPRIEGTLAFERLVLDPYLGAPEASEAQAPEPLFDWALLKYFDADLRISAAEIAASKLKLGRGGFTLTAKHGVVASEVGELELCGGQVTGRVGLDLSQAAPKAAVVGNLTDVAAGSCLAALGSGIPFKGVTGLQIEFATEGSTWEALTRRLSGDFKLQARNGAVPVDLPRLLARAGPLDEGWTTTEATPFETLNADCRLAQGYIWCHRFDMQTRGGLVSGTGDVDMIRHVLDWSLSVAGRAGPVEAAQLSAETPPKLSIRGPLAQPMIRRADRPTFGGGSTQTGPMENPVSPD